MLKLTNNDALGLLVKVQWLRKHLTVLVLITDHKNVCIIGDINVKSAYRCQNYLIIFCNIKKILNYLYYEMV